MELEKNKKEKQELISFAQFKFKLNIDYLEIQSFIRPICSLLVTK